MRLSSSHIIVTFFLLRQGCTRAQTAVRRPLLRSHPPLDLPLAGDNGEGRGGSQPHSAPPHCRGERKNRRGQSSPPPPLLRLFCLMFRSASSLFCSTCLPLRASRDRSFDVAITFALSLFSTPLLFASFATSSSGPLPSRDRCQFPSSRPPLPLFQAPHARRPLVVAKAALMPVPTRRAFPRSVARLPLDREPRLCRPPAAGDRSPEEVPGSRPQARGQGHGWHADPRGSRRRLRLPSCRTGARPLGLLPEIETQIPPPPSRDEAHGRPISEGVCWTKLGPFPETGTAAAGSQSTGITRPPVHLV